MSRFADLIGTLTNPKLHPEQRNMTLERFQLWRQSIQPRLPSSTNDLIELYLDSWQTYQKTRLKDDPDGDPQTPDLSTRGLRQLVLTDALRFELFGRLSFEQMMEMEAEADKRLAELLAQTCANA